MNERIKELAKHHLVRDEHTEFGWQECHKYEFDPDELEKFAELIVRECMSQIEEVKQLKVGHASPEYTQGFDDGMFVAIRTIEEHFGVEE